MNPVYKLIILKKLQKKLKGKCSESPKTCPKSIEEEIFKFKKYAKYYDRYHISPPNNIYPLWCCFDDCAYLFDQIGIDVYSTDFNCPCTSPITKDIAVQRLDERIIELEILTREFKVT